MVMILLIILVFFIILYPQFYVQKILSKYKAYPKTFPLTGFQLAEELLSQNHVKGVVVEKIEGPDHYDPMAKAVRLHLSHFEGHDLTSLVVAAHEVGHALQDHENYSLLKLRTTLATWAHFLQKFGSLFMMASPLLALVTRSPRIGAISLFLGLAGLFSNAIINFVTLPVEIDASFKRALPILEKRSDFGLNEQRAAHEILRACAYTYLASSLADLLNVMRWLAILRKR
jgi:hypothetical protein